jgi:ABC-type lipoprotein release transport system permease subunit
MLRSIAWRNLWRNPRRTLLTAATMALAVAFCIFMSSASAGFMHNLHEAVVDRSLGHLQIHHPDYPETMSPYDVVPDADSVVARLQEDPDVRTVAPRVQAFGMYAGKGDEASTGALVGVDPMAEAGLTKVNERLLEGVWLEGGRQAVVGYRLAKKLGLSLNSDLLVVTHALDGSIGNQNYKTVGIFKTGNIALDEGAMIPLKAAQELLVLGSGVHEVVIVGHTMGSLLDIQMRAKERWPGLSTRAWYEIAPDVQQMEILSEASMLFFILAIIGVATFIILNTLLMSVYERTREFGLLAAMGLKPRKVIHLVLAESAMLAGLAAAMGVCLGLMGHWYLSSVGLPMEVSEGEGFVLSGVALDPVLRGILTPGAVLMPVLTVLVVSTVGGLWPAWRAGRLEAVDALSQE